MKEKRVVEMRIDDFEFGYVLPEDDEYYLIPSDKSTEEASRDLKCSPELLKTIINNFEYLKECLQEDLSDLYKLTQS